MNNLKISIVLSGLLLFCSVVTAQKVELGLWGGVSSYSGEFTPTNDVGSYLESVVVEPGGGVFVRFNPTDPISFRASLNIGRISGEDGVTNEITARENNFRSNITEFALTLDINLFRLGNPRGTQFVPYISGGASVFRYNPEGNIDGNWVELQPLGTEAQGAPGYEAPYSLTNYALIAGGGLKFIINQKLTIGLEISSHKTFTDYLDDLSGTEVNYLDVLSENGTLAAQLSNPSIKDPDNQPVIYTRGGDLDDWFSFAGISFAFQFGGTGVNNRGIGCPTF